MRPYQRCVSLASSRAIHPTSSNRENTKKGTDETDENNFRDASCLSTDRRTSSLSIYYISSFNRLVIYFLNIIRWISKNANSFISY